MKKFILFLCVYCLTLNLFAQKLEPQLSLEQAIPIDPKLKKVVLPNGFTYYFKHNKYPEKKLELRLVVNAGSVLEKDNQQGLAHFLEHMNFNGSAHFQKNELVSYLQSIGVSFGADLNAYTGFDETVYILPIPTTDSNIVNKGFQIMEDWSHLALLTPKDIDEERNIVLEESRMRNGAQHRMIKKLLPNLFAGSVYADRLPIGQDSILKTFSPATLSAYHKEWYRPDLSALVIVGDIDEATPERLLLKHFSSWKNTTTPTVRKEFDVPEMEKNKAAIILDKEATNFSISLEFSPIKEKQVLTIADYKKNIARSLAGIVLQLRVQELLQTPKPPFASASIGISNTLARNYNNLSADAQVGAVGLDTAVNGLVLQLLKAAQRGFLPQELEVAKQYFLSSMESAYQERDKTKSQNLVGEYVRNFLTQECIPGIENEYAYTKFLLPQITVANVKDVLLEYLLNKKFFAVVVAPETEAKKLPTEEQLVGFIERAFSQRSAAEKQKVLPQNLLDKEPIAGKIIAETKDNELGIRQFTLSNGLKVTLKSTAFKDDQILFHLVEKGGTNNFPAQNKYTFNSFVSVLETMGYGQFSATDLQKFLAGKTVSVSPFLNSLTHGYSGSSIVKDIQTCFQLLHLKATQARWDTALFTTFKDKQKAATKFILLNPNANFSDTLVQILQQHHAYTPLAVPRPEYFDQISLGLMQKTYPSYWHQLSDANLFIIGTIVADSLKPLLEKYIASLPSSQDKQNFQDVGMRQAKNNGNYKHYFGTDDKSLISVFFSKDVPYSDEKAIQLSVLSEILQIKLIEEIREKKSWVYGLRVSLSIDKYPYERINAAMSFPCGPKNVDSILTATWQEIADIQTNGPSDINLNKAKKQLLEHLRENEKTNEYWKGVLESIVVMNKSKQSFLTLATRINSITQKDVQTIATELLQKENAFTGILYPATKQ